MSQYRERVDQWTNPLVAIRKTPESLAQAEQCIRELVALAREMDEALTPPPGTQDVRLPVLGSVWGLDGREVQVVDFLLFAAENQVRLRETDWPIHGWHEPLDRFLAEATYLLGAG